MPFADKPLPNIFAYDFTAVRPKRRFIHVDVGSPVGPPSPQFQVHRFPSSIEIGLSVCNWNMESVSSTGWRVPSVIPSGPLHDFPSLFGLHRISETRFAVATYGLRKPNRKMAIGTSCNLNTTYRNP